MANHLDAAAIIALTETGFTSRLISKYRPDCPILAITSSRQVVSRLAMNWGVLPIQYDGEGSDKDKVAYAIKRAKDLNYLGEGDVVIMTAGSSWQAGSTDLIRILRVE